MGTVSIKLVTALGFLIAGVVMLPLVLNPVFAVSEKINVDLIVDTTTLKFTDVNNNQQPDPGEFSVVTGKLYTKGTQDEIGLYRCSFSWGGWANSTEGVPVTPGLQIFDMKGNGTIVVVGDEPPASAIGKQVVGAIAGGTGELKGISGTATLTAKPMEGTNWPIDVALDVERPS